MYKIKLNDLGILTLEPTKYKVRNVEVLKYFKGYTYIHNNELVLIKFKNKFDAKQSIRLVANDNIFLFFDKDIEFNFDKNGFINGLAIYQIYNDDIQMLESIVKGKKYEEVLEYKDFLSQFDILIEKKGKNAKLISKNNDIIYLNELDFSDKSISWCISFILGLILFYGNIVIKDNKLITFKIDINFQNTYLNYEQIYTLKEKLQENNIILNISFDNNNKNLSITSYDYEIEKIVKDFYFDKEDNIIVSREENQNKIKEKLKQYCIDNTYQLLNPEDIHKIFEKKIKILKM